MDNKINNLISSADIYFYLNNAYMMGFLKLCEKVIKDKNYNIIFDKNVEDKKVPSINALIKNKDKEVEIRINPYSQIWGEIILIHEISHAIETKEMKRLVLDYASKHTFFKQVLDDLKVTYKKDDISSELLANVSGELFGNKEFINNLSLEKPSIFKKIYNFIISLANKITGNKYESLFIKDLKNKWEAAYRNTTHEQMVNNIQKGTEFSIENNSKGKYVKADRQVIKGNNPLDWEKQVENYINDIIRNNKDVNVLTDNGEILTITKDTAGKAKFRNYFIDNNGNRQYMDNNQFYTKLLAEVHIDELAQISKKINKTSILDYKNHNFAKNGFDYRSAFFEDNNGDYYKITMSIGKNETINTIYNVGKLEQRKRPVISGSSVNNNSANGSLSGNNIPQSKEKVKLPN